MSTENTTPEFYDEEIIDSETKKEQILMNENDILAGILNLEKEKNNPDNYRKIQIKRQGKTHLEFRVRPLTEDENRTCLKQATPTAKNKNVQMEANWVKYRSLLIYSATVNEDRAKIWDSPRVKDALNVIQGWEIVDKIIFAGEKSQIIEIIEEISGFGEDLDEEVKN